MALLCLTEAGDAQLRIGDYSGAQRSAAQALTIDPNSQAALALREEILRGRGATN